MDTTAIIVAIVIGVPVVGAFSIPIAAIIRSWSIKTRELKLKEKQLLMEEKMRTDELNVRILRMDDMGITPAEFASMQDEVRRLREEVAEIKQQLGNRDFIG